MNLKDEKEILCLNTPKELLKIVNEFSSDVTFFNQINALDRFSFVIAFVLSTDDIIKLVNDLKDKLSEDVKFWICYPKKSSKLYKSDVNRDHGWNPLGEINFEPVRQVSFNEDFSALRFRRVEKIKTLTRSKKMALTDEAKQRTTDQTAVNKALKEAYKIIEEIESSRRKKDATVIFEVMREVIDDELVVWDDKCIGYGVYHYVNKTSEGDMPILGFVVAKAHITMYFAVGGLKHYESYLEQLGNYRRGKICLYISNMDKVNKEVLKELVKTYYQDVQSKKVVYET